MRKTTIKKIQKLVNEKCNATFYIYSCMFQKRMDNVTKKVQQLIKTNNFLLGFNIILLLLLMVAMGVLIYLSR